MAENEAATEIGRIQLTDTRHLVLTLVGSKLDIREFIVSERYTGPTRRGLRFYVGDGNWEAFKKLVEKADELLETIL